DTLNYSSYITPVAVNLQTKTATATAGIANLEGIIGGSAKDTLRGPDQTNSWNIAGANAGILNGFAFTSLENLLGGTLNDSFHLADGAGVMGYLNGSSGLDALDYSSFGAASTVNLQTGSATGTAGIAYLESVIGSLPASTTLLGANRTNIWNI